MGNKKLLVTTADERTWDTDRDILFLGEWCRKFSRRKVWDRPDHNLHLYHWDDRDKYYSDYLLINDVYERKLRFISSGLNYIHGVNKDVKYWRIIIGPWLRFFIDAIYDRYEIIRTVLETQTVEDTYILKYSLEEWCPEGFKDFFNDFTNDPWNHIVFSEILKKLNPNIIFRSVSGQIDRKNIKRPENTRTSIISFFSKLIPSWANSIVIISMNMPTNLLFKLQVSLKQLPYLFVERETITNVIIDKNKRILLNDKNINSKFEEILNQLIIEWMPKAYIENYKTLLNKSVSVFPKNPKLILTGNAFQADEGFKFWAAYNTSKGIPLVISQHGGNMGIAKYNQSEDHQKLISNSFTSWGWNDKNASVVTPMPALQLTRPNLTFSSNGDVLIILASYPRYFYCQYSIPVAGQYVKYLKEIEKFVKATTNSQNIFIRLADDIFGWEIVDRFRAVGLEGNIDKTNHNLFQRLSSCKICVCTYNATVFLETLAANFPTIIFFDPKYFEIRQEAQKWIDDLRNVGILQNSSEEAADFLVKIGSNVEFWWFNPELQVVRKNFCDRYANKSENWVCFWSKYLNSIKK